MKKHLMFWLSSLAFVLQAGPYDISTVKLKQLFAQRINDRDEGTLADLEYELRMKGQDRFVDQYLQVKFVNECMNYSSSQKAYQKLKQKKTIAKKRKNKRKRGLIEALAKLFK